jgi:ribosomal protein S18 acetylase RimI-like enzyme
MRIPYVIAGSVRGVAEVDSLPGCSQIAVIHGAYVLPQARGHGVGRLAHQSRLSRLQKDLLYDAAICTADESNIAQINILEKEGWHRAMTFTSRKTGHRVSIWVKGLENG